MTARSEGNVVTQGVRIVPGLVRLELRRDLARRTRRPFSTSGCRLLRFLEGVEPFLEFGHPTIEWIHRTQLRRDIIDPTAQPLSRLSDQTTRKPDNPPEHPLPDIREISNEIPVPADWAFGLSHTPTMKRPLHPIRELSNEIHVRGDWAFGLSHTRTIGHVVSSEGTRLS